MLEIEDYYSLPLSILKQEFDRVRTIKVHTSNEYFDRETRIAVLNKLLKSSTDQPILQETKNMQEYQVEFSGTMTVKGENFAEVIKRLNNEIPWTPNVDIESITMIKK
jgi:hypothetical protein